MDGGVIVEVARRGKGSVMVGTAKVGVGLYIGGG
jgi:hypothetical protein